MLEHVEKKKQNFNIKSYFKLVLNKIRVIDVVIFVYICWGTCFEEALIEAFIWWPIIQRTIFNTFLNSYYEWKLDVDEWILFMSKLHPWMTS
jgi:hypothetical protein